MTLKHFLEKVEGKGQGASPHKAQRNGVILDSFGGEIPSLLPGGAGDQVDVELLELEMFVF